MTWSSRHAPFLLQSNWFSVALNNGEWKETGVGSDRDGTLSLEFSVEGLQWAEGGGWVSDAGTP